MTGKKIIEILEKHWPGSYACDWDNVGLLVGRDDKEIKTVFVCLDITEETIAQALKAGADMMISHHPLIFSGIKRINNQDFMGRKLLTLIQNDIVCYAMHTNFDVLGMAELNRRCLGLQEAEVLEITAEKEGHAEGIGRIGALSGEKTLREWSELVKKAFDIPQVLVYGNMDQIIRRAAVSSGSGKSMVRAAIEGGADVLVTGDIDYHTGIDAVAQGMAIIDAGHYGTEFVFISYMADRIRKLCPELSVHEAVIRQPFEVI